MIDFILQLKPKFTDGEKEKCIPVIDKVFKYASIAHNGGFLALEPEIGNEQDTYAKRFLGMAVSGVGKYSIKECMQIMILADDHEGAELLERLLFTSGMLCMLDGDNPRIIREFLFSMLGEKYLQRYWEENPELTIDSAFQILKNMIDKKTLPECVKFEKELSQINRIVMSFILREIDHDVLVDALLGCEIGFIFNHILSTVSHDNCIMICEDMNNRKDIPVERIVNAQKKILDKIDNMAEEGLIVLFR